VTLQGVDTTSITTGTRSAPRRITDVSCYEGCRSGQAYSILHGVPRSYDPPDGDDRNDVMPDTIQIGSIRGKRRVIVVTRRSSIQPRVREYVTSDMYRAQ